MAALTVKDWGRIYAYMLLKDREGDDHYTTLLETNPIQGITEIIQALNKDSPGLWIDYTPNVDVVWDIERPAGISDGNLSKYRSGELKARLSLRFAC